MLRYGPVPLTKINEDEIEQGFNGTQQHNNRQSDTEHEGEKKGTKKNHTTTNKGFNGERKGFNGDTKGFNVERKSTPMQWYTKASGATESDGFNGDTKGFNVDTKDTPMVDDSESESDERCDDMRAREAMTSESDETTTQNKREETAKPNFELHEYNLIGVWTSLEGGDYRKKVNARSPWVPLNRRVDIIVGWMSSEGGRHRRVDDIAWQPVKSAVIGLATCELHVEDCSTLVQIAEEGILAAILIFLESQDKGILDATLNGPFVPTKTVDSETDVLEVTHVGTDEVKRARKNALIQEYEFIFDVQKQFTHIVNHLMALGKVFDKEEINIKILKSLNMNWQPKVTAISKSKDLTTMNMATLFSKLREHELELGRLKDEEEIEENKSIALKATSKNLTKAEMDDKELMTLMVRKFSRLMQNDSQLFNHAGQSKKKSFSTNTVQCYGCGKKGHIKPDCPEIQPKQKGKKIFPQSRNMRKKGAYIAWENSESESSSDDDADHEEKSNMCHMAGTAKSDSDSDNDEEFDKLPIEEKYQQLIQTYRELHAEAMRLEYKKSDYEYRIDNLVAENERLEKELKEALLSAKNSEIKTVTVEKACENCPIHVEKIDYLTSKLAKFAQASDSLDVVLNSSSRINNRQGIGFKGHSNRTNTRKLNELRKPVRNACFYCKCVGHTIRNCYYRHVAVPQGLCVWIPKEHVTRTDNQGPKVKWTNQYRGRNEFERIVLQELAEIKRWINEQKNNSHGHEDYENASSSEKSSQKSNDDNEETRSEDDASDMVLKESSQFWKLQEFSKKTVAWHPVKIVAWQPVKRAVIGLASCEECWLHVEDCSTWVQIAEKGMLAAILVLCVQLYLVLGGWTKLYKSRQVGATLDLVEELELLTFVKENTKESSQSIEKRQRKVYDVTIPFKKSKSEKDDDISADDVGNSNSKQDSMLGDDFGSRILEKDNQIVLYDVGKSNSEKDFDMEGDVGKSNSEKASHIIRVVVGNIYNEKAGNVLGDEKMDIQKSDMYTRLKAQPRKRVKNVSFKTP
ncbi:hypothetical protein V8G54_035433 [Vigna mungo]|uniref:CCHC-type domain-containing protein n=1 Tax=Vigna mungo TaxID=3915 RepID=A0AAQ3MEZ8_VIGMU